VVDTLFGGGSSGHDSRFRAFLDFAKKLTLIPESVTHADVAALYSDGVSRLAIQQGTLIIACFNFINRVANSLHFQTPTAVQCVLTAYFLRCFGYRILMGLRSGFGYKGWFKTTTSTMGANKPAALIGFTENFFVSFRRSDSGSELSELGPARTLRRKVLHEPSTVTEQDVADLKKLGCTEEYIFSLIVNAASSAGRLRLQVGLGAMSVHYTTGTAQAYP
jgi:hypothetical protein